MSAHSPDGCQLRARRISTIRPPTPRALTRTVSLSDVDGRAHRRKPAVDLVAYDLPPGDDWLRILRSHADSATPFLPIDHRLTGAEKRRLVDRARPSVV